MDFFSQEILIFLTYYGYPAVFFAAISVGAFGVLAAGFFAGTGALNPILVWLVVWLADITSDIFYYEVGRHWGRRLFLWLGTYFPSLHSFRKKAEWLFANHGRKTIFLVKFSYGLGATTQVLAGLSRMSRKYFISVNLLGGGIKTAILVMLGSLAGSAWQVWVETVEDVGKGITAFTVLLLIVLWLAYKGQAKVLKKIVKDHEKEIPG